MIDGIGSCHKHALSRRLKLQLIVLIERMKSGHEIRTRAYCSPDFENVKNDNRVEEREWTRASLKRTNHQRTAHNAWLCDIRCRDPRDRKCEVWFGARGDKHRESRIACLAFACFIYSLILANGTGGEPYKYLLWTRQWKIVAGERINRKEQDGENWPELTHIQVVPRRLLEPSHRYIFDLAHKERGQWLWKSQRTMTGTLK